MDDVVAWQAVQQLTGVKRRLQSDIIDMVQQAEAEGMKESDVIGLLWTGLMNAVEWTRKPDQIAEQALRHIKAYRTVFATFATSHKAQVLLLVRIQNFSYDNQQFLKIFNKVVLLLYKAEVLGA